MFQLVLKLFAVKKLKEFFLRLLAVIVDGLLNDGYQAAVRIAMEIVLEVEDLTGKNGTEKKVEAWGRIKERLGAEGRFIADSTINRAIEDTILYLKANGVIVRKDE